MRILLSGALGRMGQTVAEAIRERGFTVVAGVDVAAGREADFPVYPSFEGIREKADVLVDFTRPENLPELLHYALAQRLPSVIATTGFNDADNERIRKTAQKIPIFKSANMSLGINLMNSLIREAARTLGDAFDVEIVERHHNRKIDAPSGTALMLFDTLDKAYPEGREMVCGRESRTQARGRREIGVHAVRGGTLAGIHEVGFYGQGESLTLTHIAENRAVFAQGALAAAAFILDKPPGLYAMDDLIAELRSK